MWSIKLYAGDGDVYGFSVAKIGNWHILLLFHISLFIMCFSCNKRNLMEEFFEDLFAPVFVDGEVLKADTNVG